MKRHQYSKQISAIEKAILEKETRSGLQQPANLITPLLDSSAVPTPPLLTEDTQSPQTSSLPSTNTSTVDGPIGDRKIPESISVEIATNNATV